MFDPLEDISLLFDEYTKHVNDSIIEVHISKKMLDHTCNRSNRTENQIKEQLELEYNRKINFITH